jgi:branched-chain amino acid transport system substrate-binding protein
MKRICATIAIAALSLAFAGPAVSQQKPVSMGIVTFLTGAAAAPFGVPARNGAEITIEAINEGKLPAPYNTKGFAGAPVEPVWVDESGGNAKQVAEFRNLVEKRNVDVVLGYISSGTCAALSNVAEELKRLTVYALCSTPRVFDEAERRYIFRPISVLSSDAVAAARYLKEKFPKIRSYAGIHPNYAWGQDSARDFEGAAAKILPEVKQMEVQFPKLFQGAFQTEVSALLLSKADLIHSSLWDGDLESFIFQAKSRGLFQKKKVLFQVGDTAVYRLGDQLPEGLIIGGRGPYGILVRDRDTVLNKWFIQVYKDRYGTYPTGPAYQYAQSVLATKIAYDKAAQKAGRFPTQDEVIEAYTGLEFESFSTKVKLQNAKGHQAVTENGFGISKYDKKKREVVLTDIKFYPPECVEAPPGVQSDQWIKDGMPGAKCP